MSRKPLTVVPMSRVVHVRGAAQPSDPVLVSGGAVGLAIAYDRGAPLVGLVLAGLLGVLAYAVHRDRGLGEGHV